MRVPDRIVDVFQTIASLRTELRDTLTLKWRFSHRETTAMTMTAMTLPPAPTIVARDRSLRTNTKSFQRSSDAETESQQPQLISPAGPMNQAWIDAQFYKPVVKIELPAVEAPIMLDSLVVTEAIPQPTAQRPTVMPQSIANLAKVIERKEEPTDGADPTSMPPTTPHMKPQKQLKTQSETKCTPDQRLGQ